MFPKSLEISLSIAVKKEEEEDIKKKIMFDLTKFCRDNEIMDCLKKLQKEDMHEPQVFFKIEYATLERVMDVKPEGKKIKVMKKVKELREKFEKEGFIHYVD